MSIKPSLSSLAKSSSGFTLLEVLVVLVLLSMVMTMLMHGLSMVFNLRTRILVQIDGQRVQRLQAHLLTDLLSGLTPDDPKADAVFSGDEEGIYGLSLSSLQGDIGVPVQIRLWTTHGDGESLLLYKQQGRVEVELGRWPLTNVEFAYVDQQGESYRTWPESNSDQPQLPEAIVIKVGDHGLGPVWFIPILARKQPRSNVQELFE